MTLSRTFFYIFAFLTTMTVAPTAICAETPRQTLIFSLDQGFGNGITQSRDQIGLNRVVDTLQVFQKKYDVYALLACAETDRSQLTAVLDTLHSRRVPFVLDVYGSDELANEVGNTPFDASHGRALSIKDLASLKEKYGESFAGVRLFEIFSFNNTILSGQKLGTKWATRTRPLWPQDSFFEANYVEEYVRFCAANHMFALFEDWFWLKGHNYAFVRDTVKQAENEEALKKIIEKYPRTVIVGYSNNEPNHVSAKKTESWVEEFLPFLAHGARAISLSDQAWFCTPDDEMTCPAKVLAHWATFALAHRVDVIQFEPYFYFFNFPKARNAATPNYGLNSEWKDRGRPTKELREVAAALSVDLAPIP